MVIDRVRDVSIDGAFIRRAAYDEVMAPPAVIGAVAVISPNWALLAQRYARNKKTTRCVVLCIWLRLLGSNQRPTD